MEHISWTDFEKVELRAGTVVEVKEFPEARKPALILSIEKRLESKNPVHRLKICMPPVNYWENRSSVW